MAVSDELTEEIGALAEQKGVSLAGLSDLAALAIAPASIPLALMLMVGTYAKEAHDRNKHLSQTPMPDGWLQGVAESEVISKDGLALLAKCLDEKGFVSVKDAQDWANLEERKAHKRESQGERQKNLEGQGAQALLCRAKQECPSMFDVDISRSMARIRESGRAVLGSLDWLSKRIRP